MANQPKKYKKFVATAATATLVASAIVPVASAAGFTDVENNTHKDAINALSDAGIINGYADGTFKPNQTINRGQVVKLLGRWLETEGFEIPSDWETSQRFKDLPLTAEKELVKYAALAKDAGVFAGSNGNLNYTQSMQRQQMAVVLVRAINEIYDLDLIAEYKEAGFKSEISDLGAAFSAEQREAITALEYAELTNAANLPGKAFKPADSITRGQFASFLYRTINLEIEDGAADATVKAINNTTVEVTFDEKVGNLDELKFEIDGLEIKNKAHKQSNDKVVVLTTAAQEAGKEYTVKLDGEVIGKFKGIEAVIPTSVDIVEKSQQNILGNNVTVKAKVTVAEGQSKAGIPVTFNIVNVPNNTNTPGSSTLNQPIIAEAVTDENGVASYTYTRYASTAQQLVTNDEVQAYATGKPALRSFSKVYWAAIQPLAITEVTTGNSINNGGKKVYKVKLAGHLELRTNAERQANNNGFVNIAFQENINVTPDKAVKDVTVTDGSGKALGYPAQFTTTSSTSTTNFNNVQVALDANGEATFTLTGSNATVTPIVFKDIYANSVNTDPSFGRLDATELQAKAPSVTFAKSQVLKLTLESVGTKDASAYAESFLNAPTGVATLEGRLGNTARFVYPGTNAKRDLAADLANTGGRDYKAVYTDKDGKIASSGQAVKVSLKIGSAKQQNQAAATPVYLVDNNSYTVYKLTDFNRTTPEEFTLLTNSKGEISFTVLGGRDSYATPTVFLETGDRAGLDKNDEQQVGEIVYFGDRFINKAKLTVNGEATANATVSDNAVFTYESVDQNNKYYYIPGVTQNFVATFQVSTTFANATVTNTTVGGNGLLGTRNQGNVASASVNQGSTDSFDVTAQNGRAQITVASTRGNRVDVVASASQATFPILSASATFSTLNNEGVAEGQSVRGRVIAIDTNSNHILLTDSKGEVVYSLKYASDELYLNGTGATEATFEGQLAVGDELYFVQKNGTAKAKFDRSNVGSGINVATPNPDRKQFVLTGETGTAINYNFGGQTIAANFLVSGDNITLSNGTINGNITVGQQNVQQTVNDFSVNNLVVNGTVTVNQGDGNTFQVLGNSRIQNVVLNIAEHVALGTNAFINTLTANVTGFAVTGEANNAAPGTVNTLVLNNNATSKSISGTTNVIPGQTITGGSTITSLVAVTTATGDTVNLTFSDNVTTADVTVVDVTTATTADVATVAVANDAKTLQFNVANATSKKFEVTKKGTNTTYLVEYNATLNVWTFTKK
ncbi:S-layer homology domain-containing protein [Lysinibacillus pakistanensis]|uniref:S-layer homology domain-containing protein n=1 Tax=Lysinibacillus pakistanensis TaxID=759811 RepID=UPI003D2927DB